MKDVYKRQIQFRDGCKTLRGAWNALVRDHLPAGGVMPPELFFTAPQYNTWIEPVSYTHLDVYKRQIVFSAGLVPWYFICTNVLHLKNSVWSLIIPSLRCV